MWKEELRFVARCVATYAVIIAVLYLLAGRGC